MEKKRKRPPRLETPKKQYTLDQCALFRVQGIGQLIHILNWKGGRKELEELPAIHGSYRTWKNEKGRTLQSAGPELRRVQTRIAILLRRVIPPEYRHSGVRGRSFLTNAQQHLQFDPSVKLDIRSFYPTTSFQHVRRFFKDSMKCAGDVAFLLAKLCCYRERHLPTGGVHSEVMAFYCHRGNFEKLLARVTARGGTMTVYVDDIMLTMPGASLTDLEWARRLFAQQGVKIHPGKSKVIPKRGTKVITGVEVRGGRVRAPKRQHMMIKQRLDEIREAPADQDVKSAVNSLLGHMDHVAQIDPRFQARACGTRRRFKAVLNNE